MISLIIGTNRPGSNTRKIAAQLEEFYAELKVPLRVLDLAHLPPEIFHRVPTRKNRNHSSLLRTRFCNPPDCTSSPRNITVPFQAY